MQKHGQQTPSTSYPSKSRITAFLVGTTRGSSQAMRFAPLNGGPTALLSQYQAIHNFATRVMGESKVEIVRLRRRTRGGQREL
ncbi:unnamed protein product [Fusarium graminearum]|uniref:Uncharacterized protein n=1 Tax=Gibberella zeae TaxID=5518 RepID=A0A4U9F1A2_GIBZA|nr:unnamed protein product [Fusarium graminearum]CAF3538682.1 unnamed protein product [Fusarium graminearum]CAF3653796.1 unnamed protein product [Fusarium graminearum]CAG1959658.1 unnamed protein product [Fusarium graminearum]CAG1986488.1 unnamed protein product [Fusarium graminearum]